MLRFATAVAGGLLLTLPAAYGQGCDQTDCSTTSSTSAYKLCYEAVKNGVFDPAVVPEFMSEAEMLAWCAGSCAADSRLAYHDPESSNYHPGNVWDMCSGCATSVVTGFCNDICDGGEGIAICTPAATRGCTLVSGDPGGDGASEEFMGAVASADACRDLVISHRGAATGMAWSTNDYDNDGLGSCYAEYGSTEYANLGTSHYSSCIFSDSANTTPTESGGGELQDTGTQSPTPAPTPSPTPAPTPAPMTPPTTPPPTDRAVVEPPAITDPPTLPPTDIIDDVDSSSGEDELDASDRMDELDASDRMDELYPGKGSKGKGNDGKGCGKDGKGCGSLSSATKGISAGASISLVAVLALATGMAGMVVHRRHKMGLIESEIAEDNEEQIKALLMHETSPLLDDGFTVGAHDVSEIKAMMV